MENQAREKPFTSWKEIAAYLGCDERTCLRWEKERGLPVHRAGGGASKSLVFAYKSELDEWLGKRGSEKTVKLPLEAVRAGFRSRPALPFALASLGFLIIGAAILFLFILKPSGPQLSEPCNFHIEGSTLIVTNRKDSELWRYETGVEDLMDEPSYRAHLGRKRIGIDSEPLMPRIKFEDIDDDGRVEVLINIRSLDDSAPSFLLCLDAEGKPLWSYTPGREMVFGQRRFSPDYFIDGIDVLKFPRTRTKVVVFARHKPDFPSCLAVLDVRGRKLGEYWNSGRITDYALADIDGDGLPALVIVGTNNEYRKGFLAVLDPDFVWGGSPQTGPFQSPDLKPGSEICYLLFPRTDVDKIEFSQRECMLMVEVLKNNVLMTLSQGGRIIYELKPSMEVYSVIISDAYKEKFHKFQAEGLIPPGPLDANALSVSLAGSIVYYDGQRWTTTRALNKMNYHIFAAREAEAAEALRKK
jgi:hypothetical protein